jgi:hypothetical protein
MSHDQPSRVAFCPLLFASNGGTFDERGRPVFSSGRRGLCGIAFDCGRCRFLIQWVEAEAAKGWSVGWECWECLDASYRYERENKDVSRVLPGFYHSGRPHDLTEDDPDFDPDRPSLEGCTSCGKGSSFLSLILRRANLKVVSSDGAEDG